MYIPSSKVAKVALLFSAISVLPLTSPVMAQTVWNATSGEWLTAGNWSSGTPSSSVAARFAPLAGGSNEVYVTIGSGAAKSASAQAVQVFFGTKVNLEMQEGSSLNASSVLWRVGYDFASPNTPPSAASTLTISGPASGKAQVTLGQFLIGAADGSNLAEAGGHRLTFSGENLNVITSGTPTSVVGRFGNNNRLEVLSGANVALYNLDIAATNVGAGKSGNTLLVSGDDSFLNIQGTLRVGDRSGTRSNSTIIGGHTPSSSGKQATLRVKSLNIGGDNTNHGGNRLVIKDGGRLETVAETTLYSFSNNGGDNDGMNRLEIEAGGVFSAGATITSQGRVVLNKGGILEGRNSATDTPVAINLIIEPTGRLEVSGAGLAANVMTLIQNGQIAVGVTSEDWARSSGDLLTLQSEVRFHSIAGGVLEMSWFGESDFDQIDLLSTGALTGSVRLNLKLLNGATPLAGDEWQLFKGNTAAITASFDLSTVDPAIWNTSSFNELGGWRLVAIPEPASVLLIGAGLLMVAARYRRKI